MKIPFSLRHGKAIQKGTLKVSLNQPCRVMIKRVLESHSEIDNNDGEFYEFRKVIEELKTCYGTDELRAYKNSKLVPTNSLEDVIVDDWPGHVLDVVEVWLEQNPKKARDCERELNLHLLSLGSPWHFVDGEAILVDSEFLNSEVRTKCVQLLGKNEIPGAQEEYREAISDLTSGDTKNAVVNAHKSVESVMKAVLDINQGTFGALLDKLIKSGMIPDYYDEFLTHFEKLALGVVKERNLPARGHGQGKEPTEVSHALAEFAVHLAGSINLFIVQRWVENKEVEDDLNF